MESNRLKSSLCQVQLTSWCWCKVHGCMKRDLGLGTRRKQHTACSEINFNFTSLFHSLHCNTASLMSNFQARSHLAPRSSKAALCSPSLPTHRHYCSHSSLQLTSSTLPAVPCSVMQLLTSGIIFFNLCPSSTSPCFALGCSEELCPHSA